MDLGAMAMKGYSTFPQSPSITGTSPLDCLVSYTGHSLGESYPSAEKQLLYSTAQTDWENDQLWQLESIDFWKSVIIVYSLLWSNQAYPKNQTWPNTMNGILEF